MHLLNWQMGDGLPSNKVTSALQARDGYVWAGTFEGLARFDGVAFTRFDAARVPGMVDSSVTALGEGPDGSIWIGHESGAVSRYHQGQFSFFPVPRERQGIRIQNFAADADGDVWSLDVAGHLIRLRDGRLLTPPSGTARGVFAMGSSSAGEVWIIARGRLSTLVHGSIAPVALPPAMGEYVHGACFGVHGELWIIAEGHLWQRKAGAWGADLGGIPTGRAPVVSLVQLKDRRLLGGTLDRGAFLLDPAQPSAGRVLRPTTGFPSEWITSVFEDQENGVWLATGTAGLFRLGEEKVRMLLPPDGLHGRAALSAAPVGNDEFWVGTEGSGVYHVVGDRWTQFAQDAGVSNPYVWSVCRDSSDHLWIGTWGSGIFRLAGAHFEQRADEFASTGVAAMIPSRGGGLIVGSLQGVFRYDGEHGEWLEPGPTRRLKNVRALLEDDDGSIWVGSHGEGLGVIHGAHLRQFTHRDGLSSDYVDCLHRDEAGGLWIGTHGGGLNCFKDGRFAVISTANGLADNTIEHIEEDGLGFFWLSSKAGILRVAAAELNACAAGESPRLVCVTYGLSDGLSTLNCSGANQPAGAKLPDGRLVFATDRGLAVIQPRQVKINRIAPKVWIESGRAGDSLLFNGPVPAAPIVIAPGTSRIELKYTGLSFAGPDKVVFRRQLQPLEPTPMYVGSERLAVYSYVPPGRYVFSVTAANRDGVWSAPAQTVTLIVLPHFWQTVWFKFVVGVSVVVATGSLAWVGSRRRLQRQLERLERERAIERERTRIANDMHDDLGASLTRITMLSETAQRQIADPAHLRQGLRQIYDTARGITRSMDEIVWAVNPKHDTLESLVSYFEKFAVDFLRAAGVRCRLDLPLECPDRTPSSEVRHNLFLCLKEALNNVVRHSGADTATLTIQVTDATCAVIVSDNGGGLRAAGAPAEANGRIASGNGLASMHARLAAIGGTCTIANGPAGGCVVTLTVPLVPTAEAGPTAARS